MRKKTIAVVSSVTVVVLVLVAVVVMLWLRRKPEPEAEQEAEQEFELWSQAKIDFVKFIAQKRIDNQPIYWESAEKDKTTQIAILYDFLNGQDVEQEWDDKQKENWSAIIGFFIFTYLQAQQVDISPLRELLGGMSDPEKAYSWNDFKKVNQPTLRAKIFEVYSVIQKYFLAFAPKKEE